MLNLLRRSANTFIIKMLLVLLALSFMVWGVGSYINSSNQLPVAEADGWSIGRQEFSQAYDHEFRSMRERFGGSLDKKTAEMLGLKTRTLNALINRHLILSAGAHLHLTVSADILRHRIAATPAFQNKGKFDKERYNQLLYSNRMTPLEFENQLTADIVTEQLRRTTGTLVALPKALVEDVYHLENEKRIVTTFALKAKDLEETIQATDAELEAYLKKNNQNFMTQAKVKVNFALLNTDSVRDLVKVTEDEIKEFYTEHSKEYQKPETRKVRHILVKTDEKTNAEAAMKKIQQAQERLKNAEPFEAVAKALSDDATADQGGDLGTFGRGVMVPPFEQVAFSAEVGKVSPPVTTQYGIHLILVDQINPATSKPLEAVTTEIKGRIVENKAQDLVYDRSTTFEDQLFTSGKLKTISTDLNLRYKELDFFTRSDPKLTGVEREQKFLDAAFSTPKGTLSPLIELPNNQFVALEVIEIEAPTPKTLEQTRVEVLAAYKQEKAKEEANKIMTTALKTLSDGKSPDEIQATHAKIVTTTTQPFIQEGKEKEPSANVKEIAFNLTLNKPNHTALIEENDHTLILRLLKIIDAPNEGFKEAETELTKKLDQSIGQEQLIVYINGLWSRANIRIHHEILDQL